MLQVGARNRFLVGQAVAWWWSPNDQLPQGQHHLKQGAGAGSAKRSCWYAGVVDSVILAATVSYVLY